MQQQTKCVVKSRYVESTGRLLSAFCGDQRITCCDAMANAEHVTAFRLGPWSDHRYIAWRIKYLMERPVKRWISSLVLASLYTLEQQVDG